jgi:DNA-binding MarR family transcriptional regulator
MSGAAQPSEGRPTAQSTDSSPERELAARLRSVTGGVNRVVHRFAAARGLHPTDVQALAAMLDAGSELLTPGRLGERLGLSSGATTACLDRLERARQIRRVRDSDDRRVVRLHWAAEAREDARSYFQPLSTATRSACAGFSPAELAVVTRFLDALGDRLEEKR